MVVQVGCFRIVKIFAFQNSYGDTKTKNFGQLNIGHLNFGQKLSGLPSI